MKQPPGGDPGLCDLISRLVAGDEGAGDELYRRLERPVRTAAQGFFPPGRPEADDVVQESILAVYTYVRSQGGFEGDLIRFAVTIARNRCRNIVNQHRRRGDVPLEPLAQWIADPDRSPLDVLEHQELRSILRTAVARLGKLCRLILRAFYFEGRSIADIRRDTGLKTVQGVYYRRSVCLQQVKKLVEERLS